MTCSGCREKVQGLLTRVEGVQKVSIDLGQSEAVIEMNKHIPATELQAALKDHPAYRLSEKSQPHLSAAVPFEEEKSWLKTYRPVLLVFGYILGITLFIEYSSVYADGMRWMNHFMAGFFLVFSFFKLLNLESFADSYAMYDVVAGRWHAWGYVYAFLELALGLALLTGFSPIITNAVTLVIMSVSIVGVLQSVLNKRKIQCACLGAVFNLPMSTITILEDAAMIAMSGIVLITYL
jgi:cation transport ATPase